MIACNPCLSFTAYGQGISSLSSSSSLSTNLAVIWSIYQCKQGLSSSLQVPSSPCGAQGHPSVLQVQLLPALSIQQGQDR